MRVRAVAQLGSIQQPALWEQVGLQILRSKVRVLGRLPLLFNGRMSMFRLAELVKNGKKVRFVRARRGELIYATECGFEFRVPFDDMDDGVFLAEDRAAIFMRWIRKELKAIEVAA